MQCELNLGPGAGEARSNNRLHATSLPPDLCADPESSAGGRAAREPER